MPQIWVESQHKAITIEKTGVGYIDISPNIICPFQHRQWYISMALKAQCKMNCTYSNFSSNIGLWQVCWLNYALALVISLQNHEIYCMHRLSSILGAIFTFVVVPRPLKLYLIIPILGHLGTYNTLFKYERKQVTIPNFCEALSIYFPRSVPILVL